MDALHTNIMLEALLQELWAKRKSMPNPEPLLRDMVTYVDWRDIGEIITKAIEDNENE